MLVIYYVRIDKPCLFVNSLQKLKLKMCEKYESEFELKIS